MSQVDDYYEHKIDERIATMTTPPEALNEMLALLDKLRRPLMAEPADAARLDDLLRYHAPALLAMARDHDRIENEMLQDHHNLCGEIEELKHDRDEWLNIANGYAADIAQLTAMVERREDENERLKSNWIKESFDIQQALGRALGYPEEDGSVNTMDHVASTIAVEAAQAIERLRAGLRDIIAIQPLIKGAPEEVLWNNRAEDYNDALNDCQQIAHEALGENKP